MARARRLRRVGVTALRGARLPWPLVLASAVTHGEAWTTFSAFNQAFTGV